MSSEIGSVTIKAMSLLFKTKLEMKLTSKEDQQTTGAIWLTLEQVIS
jgi:hypothetical protein